MTCFSNAAGFCGHYQECAHLALRLAAGIPFKTDDAGRPTEIDSETYIRRLNNAGFNSQLTKAAQERLLAPLVDHWLRKDALKMWRATAGARLLVGAGASHVTENSLYYHQTYGLPYIPGSALKGTTRHYVVHYLLAEELEGKSQSPDPPTDCLDRLLALPRPPAELLNKIRRGETNREKLTAWIARQTRCRVDGEIRRFSRGHLEVAADFFLADQPRESWENLFLARLAFGNQGASGGIEFLDAPPLSGRLETDILTPHYGEYYRDDRHQLPPADYLQPVPVHFPAVAAGSRFRIAIRVINEQMPEELIDTVGDWLETALEANGVGGKTSIGYGWFREVSPEGEDILRKFFLDHLRGNHWEQWSRCEAAGIPPQAQTIKEALESRQDSALSEPEKDLVTTSLLEDSAELWKSFQDSRFPIISALLSLFEEDQGTLAKLKPIVTEYGSKKSKEKIKKLASQPATATHAATATGSSPGGGGPGTGPPATATQTTTNETGKPSPYEQLRKKAKKAAAENDDEKRGRLLKNFEEQLKKNKKALNKTERRNLSAIAKGQKP